MSIRTVGVVGAGKMGSGIVEQCARSGYSVVAREVDGEALDAGKGRVQESMGRGVARGKLSGDERDEAWSRIAWTVDIDDLRECDLVVEAAIENLALKKEIFGRLDAITRPDAILASNTSSVSITALGSTTSKPDKVAGAHFFNPVPVMPLVELVRGFLTSDDTIETLRGFGESLGKKIVVAKDTPGFIVNYLLIPYLLDAVRAVESGMAPAEDIDTAMTLGTGVPMGPLTLADFIGLDTTLYIADAMYEEFRDPKYVAPPLLRSMVTAGYYGKGKKGNRGFYDYNRR